MLNNKIETYTYTNDEGIVFNSKSVRFGSCLDCAFETDVVSCCKAVKSVNCSSNDIIWVKKESIKEPNAPAVVTSANNLKSTEGIKYDQEKERYDLVPVLALEEVAKVLTAGAAKYGDDNWRHVPYSSRRYYSATMRHMQLARKGEPKDNETGLHHYAHAISNLMFLLEKELEKELNVDVFTDTLPI